MTCDRESSGLDSSMSSSSLLSWDEGSGSAGRTQQPGNYEKIFEDPKDAAAAPPLIYVKGLPHFRSKTTSDLVNAGKPPNTLRRPYQSCHWYWQGAADSCKGAP